MSDETVQDLKQYFATALAQATANLVSKDDLAAAIKPLASKADLAAAVKPLASRAELTAAIKPLATRQDLGSTEGRLIKRMDKGFNEMMSGIGDVMIANNDFRDAEHSKLSRRLAKRKFST